MTTGSLFDAQCQTCDGDGYLERWNDDQSDVVISICPDCDAGRKLFDQEVKKGEKLGPEGFVW